MTQAETEEDLEEEIQLALQATVGNGDFGRIVWHLGDWMTPAIKDSCASHLLGCICDSSLFEIYLTTEISFSAFQPWGKRPERSSPGQRRPSLRAARLVWSTSADLGGGGAEEIWTLGNIFPSFPWRYEYHVNTTCQPLRISPESCHISCNFSRREHHVTKQSLQVAKANSVQVLPKQQCVVFSSLVSCLRRHANSDTTVAERRQVSLQLAQDLWMPSLKTEEVHKKASNKNSMSCVMRV